MRRMIRSRVTLARIEAEATDKHTASIDEALARKEDELLEV